MIFFHFSGLNSLREIFLVDFQATFSSPSSNVFYALMFENDEISPQQFTYSMINLSISADDCSTVRYPSALELGRF